MVYPDSQYNGYIYVIAGGETLALLERLKDKALFAKQTLEQMATAWGAQFSLDPYQSMFTFNGTLPAGWEKFPSRNGDNFIPDQTLEGYNIATKINIQKRQMDLSYAFSEACAKSCGNVRWNDYTYSFEQIGAQIVVKCPPASNAGKLEYAVPPDSTPITFSAYAKMKEDAGLLPPAVTTAFRDKFQP